MKKFLLLLFVCYSCESDPIAEIVPKDKWMFVACEGNFGSSNGSIYMINQKGDVKVLMILAMLFSHWKFIRTSFLLL